MKITRVVALGKEYALTIAICLALLGIYAEWSLIRIGLIALGAYVVFSRVSSKTLTKISLVLVALTTFTIALDNQDLAGKIATLMFFAIFLTFVAIILEAIDETIGEDKKI